MLSHIGTSNVDLPAGLCPRSWASSHASEHVIDDEHGRRGTPLGEAEEWTEVACGGEPGNIKAGDRRLEGFVENGETVDHLEAASEPIEVWDTRKVGLVPGGEDETVERQTVSTCDHHRDRATVPHCGLHNVRARPATDSRVGEARREPPLEGKTADFPKLLSDFHLLGDRQ